MRRNILIGAGALVAALLLVFAFRYYYTNQHYVSTDNALISGDVVQVAPSNGGRVTSVAVDVGDVIKKDQALGSVEVPAASTLGLSAGASGPTQGTEITADLVSPVNGVVVAKTAAVGDVVSPGQPVLSVVDLGKLWVTANVDEAQISRINVGQGVEVHVDALGKTLKGSVMAITPASAATFSLLPQNNTSGNYTKVTQRVPVKIAVDYAGDMLFPGTSAEVTIKVS
ncbi:MAG TPA: efflux RND transporter periplasmic adaptor subunit [Chloroflexota bacterium]|nr:efflux RND transporter periplasmic adaptor subunit [Chloroflexota bacterium]